MLRKHPNKNNNKFLISSSMAIIIQVCSFLALISFVSITLAQEDSRYVPLRRYHTTNNSSEEDGLRISGISIPSFEEIRDTLRRFQAHLNSLRRNASGNGDLPRVTIVSNSNDYTPVSPGYGGRDRGVLNDPRQLQKQFTYSSSEPSAASDLQKHTTTTMYIMAVCLIIMVVGTILFICVNKFQEKTENVNSPNNESSSSSSNNNNSSRSIAREFFATNTISLAVANHERTPSSSNVAGSTSVTIPGANIEYNPRVTYDLPPSYDSLYPEGKPL